MFQFDLFEQFPGARARELLRMLATLGFAGAVLAVLGKRSLAMGLLASFLIMTLAVVGLAPAISALLLLAGAAALSCWLFGHLSTVPRLLRICACLALIGILIGWLLPFPIHHRLIYLIGLLALIAPQARNLFTDSVAGLASLDSAMRRQPVLSCVAVLALIAAALPAWLPSLMFDDLGYHLGLPHQLSALGSYRMDAASQVWAFAPWLGDCVFAVAHVLAGQDARGSVNLIWLGLSALLLYQLTRQLWPENERAAWIAVALYASLPLNAVLVAGMQTELIGSTLLLATLGLIYADKPGEALHGSYLGMVLLAAGMLLTKTSMAPFVLLLVIWYSWKQRHVLSRSRQVMLLPLVLLLGGSAYVYAFSFTGNPILPLANALFESTYFPLSNFSNSRYTLPLDAANVWALLFDSGRFYESRDGVSGFHWLVLLVPAIVAARLRPRLSTLIIIGLSTAALLYSSQSYLRYLMPAMLLMIPACAAGASLLQVRWGTALTIMLVTLNLSYQSNANWILRDGGVYRMFVSAGKDQSLRDRVAPELRLIELAKLQRTDARILLTSRARPFVATSVGQAFTTSWYDTELRLAFGDGGRKETSHLLDLYHFTHVLVHPEGSGTDVLPLLNGLGAQLVGSNGAATLWRLPERHEPGRDLLLTRDRNAIAVLREVRQRYRQWHRDRKLRHPERYPDAAISIQ